MKGSKMSEIIVEQTWDGVDLELEGGNGDDYNSTATIYYIVSGTNDDVTACKSAYNMAPANFSGVPKKSVSIGTRLSESLWKIEVHYGTQNTSDGSAGKDNDNDNNDDSETTVSFDCGGGTKHLTHSIKQTRVKGTKDAGGAIGWNGKSGSEMEITGIDVPTAQLRETYTRVMKLSRITTGFKRNVAALVGKVNSGGFKGWSAGEVMFLGMSYSCPTKKSTKVTVTFNFAIQPNESNVKIGDKSVSKKGFEYVWALSKTSADGNAPKAEVEAIYVDQVCESASFSALGL